MIYGIICGNTKSVSLHIVGQMYDKNPHHIHDRGVESLHCPDDSFFAVDIFEFVSDHCDLVSDIVEFFPRYAFWCFDEVFVEESFDSHDRDE